MNSMYKILPVGEYVKRFSPDTMIHIIAEQFYVHTTVYNLRSDLYCLMKFECRVSPLNPTTLYI